MKSVGGYARVYRAIFGHVALRDEAEEAMFMWMIGKAAWQPTRVRFRDRPLYLKRGQLAISQRDVARGFHWSLGAFQRFLNRVKAESMIDTCAESGVTIITICNYDVYQATGAEAESPAESGGGTKPSQSRVTEQEREEIKKDSPLPPKGMSRTYLPSDWKPPPVSELPPKAQACARQWPREAYEREAEGFGLYWHSERKMKADWRATWANRILTRHWAVMREARSMPDEAKPYHQLVAEGRA